MFMNYDIDTKSITLRRVGKLNIRLQHEYNIILGYNENK